MKTRYQVLIICLLCFCTFFSSLNSFYPNLMEARNFITAREMIQEGHWISTTMNLEPRLEKPPLPTWLTAFSALNFGGLKSLFALRLPSATAAFMMVLFFYAFCKELKREGLFAFLGAAILATSLLTIQMARTNSWDIYTHAFLIGSIWQLSVSIRKGSFINALIATLLMACSILSKGPVSLYALWIPYLLAMSLYTNGAYFKNNWRIIVMVLFGGLLLGFSWNIYVAIYQPEASEFILNKEINSWASKHVRPFYFYLHFPIYIGVWTVFVLSSFFYKYAKQRINKISNYKFVISWILLVLLFLSLIPTKKERYLLPILIPLSLISALIAEQIRIAYKNNEQTNWDRLILGFQIIPVSLIAIIGSLTGFFWLKIDLFSKEFFGLLFIAILGFVLLYYFFRKKVLGSIGIILIMISVFCICLLPLSEKLYYNFDGFNSLEQIQEIEELKSVKFHSNYSTVEPRLIWAAGKSIYSFDSIDFNESIDFPLAIITLNTIEEIINKDQLNQLDITYLDKYDYVRTDEEWKVNVYLVKKK